MSCQQQLRNQTIHSPLSVNTLNLMNNSCFLQNLIVTVPFLPTFDQLLVKCFFLHKRNSFWNVYVSFPFFEGLRKLVNSPQQDPSIFHNAFRFGMAPHHLILHLPGYHHGHVSHFLLSYSLAPDLWNMVVTLKINGSKNVWWEAYSSFW